MSEFNPVEKEAETGMAELEVEMEHGVDCWELVGSSPGSPSPGDVTALEETMASACNSGSLLLDNYFGCAHSRADDVVLPVSTAMADKENDNDMHSSERSDDLVSLASDTGVIENCPIHNDIMCHADYSHNADLMGQDDGTHHHDYMHHNDTYHDDLPCCSNLMSYDDQVQHDVDILDHRKMHEYMIYHNELMKPDHIEDEEHVEGIVHTDEDSGRCINQPGRSCEIVESMAVAKVYHDVCPFGSSSGLESPSYAMSMQQALAEGSGSTVLLDETGREATSQVMQVRDSVDAQHDIMNTHSRREHKGFVCASWIWTQLSRWQTQLGHGNTIWSVALAAAVMGILVLGRGWQRLQAQNQSLRSQLWAKEKRITQLMFQLMQTKDALSKIRRVPVICVKPSIQIPQDNF